MDLIVKPSEEIVKEKLDLSPAPAAKPVNYKAENVGLSDNLKKFDKKVKVYKENPYSYNSVAIKEKETLPSTPTAFAMITNPEYNMVGKFLGVDTLHEWNKDYDKVYEIVKWAKAKSGVEKTNELVQWINGALNFVPALSSNHRKIDQLYLYSKMQGVKPQTAPRVITRTIIKKVVRKVYPRQKESAEQFVNKWMGRFK